MQTAAARDRKSHPRLRIGALLLGLGLVLGPGAARADQPPGGDEEMEVPAPPPPAPAPAPPGETRVEGWRLSGQVELGGRTVTGDDWHSAKYGEYRELRPGLFGEGRFLLESPDRGWYVRGWGDDVGERDESYRLEGGRWGRYRLGFEYAEIPHAYSNRVNSFLDNRGDNDILDLFSLHPESLDLTVRRAGADLHVRPRAELEFDADYRFLEREGTRPWSLGFGNPGGNFVNLPGPIDERIHEVNGALRWATDTWTVEGSYTGSFFENRYDRLRVDNFAFPIEGGAEEGQISLEPDNAAHTFRLSGATDLPLGFPSRLSATAAYGIRKQDEDFLCHTVNPALIPGAPLSDSCPLVAALSDAGDLQLPRNSLDGEVQTFLANLVWTGRPHRRVSYTARYRLYDYSNETPVLAFPDHVENDDSIVTDTRLSVPNEYRRQNASLDVAVRPLEEVTVHVKPFWEQWTRSDDREVGRLDEWGGKVAVDAHPADWAQVRTSYEFGVRRGNEYDPFAFLKESFDFDALTPVDLAQLVFEPLRKFDQADRKRFEGRLLAQFVPTPDVSFSLSGTYGEHDYDATRFGLDHVTWWSVGGDASWEPVDRVGVSAWYSYEETRYEQLSRWRPRGFFGPALTPADSPLNDWESLTEDQVHNFGARLDLVLVPDRLDAALGYEIQSARGKTRASGTAGELGIAGMTGGGDAVNYPGLRDVLQIVRAHLDYHAREDLTLRLGYRFEKFDLTDFRIDDLDPVEPVSPTDLFLGHRIDDYTAHVFEVSAIWEF